jgi:flagellar M-ring protein FliF
MEPLINALKDLPERFGKLPAGTRIALIAGVLLLVVGAGVAVLLGVGSSEGYQYVFTNLAPEDASEASALLKTAKIPFRSEANGAALAVPASQVHEARMLLATAGLPRGGGVGFELFDRGDIGVSEFTQKVNLRRALEGELARTVGRLSEVRNARVHLSFSERGLYRDEDRKASAAVVVNLQPGRTLDERQVSGIRHLVSSAVPGLSTESVSVVDGKGNVLSDTSPFGEGPGRYQSKMERELERRIVTLLEPALGAGAVVARVNVGLDTSEVRTAAEVYDPDQVAVRNERKVTTNSNQTQPSNSGVAGAAANQPMQEDEAGGEGAGTTNNMNAASDESRNFEISRTTTTTVIQQPRVSKLSVALLIDGVDGKPRSDEELARYAELAKRAVGFDDERGDQLDVRSAVFTPSASDGTVAEAPGKTAWATWVAVGVGSLLVLLLAVGGFLALRRRQVVEPVLEAGLAGANAALPTGPFTPGMKLSELEASFGAAPGGLTSGAQVAMANTMLPEPAVALREKAQLLAGADPNKVAMLIRAWMTNDEGAKEPTNA